MAINKTFVAHTELKAQDLNELVTQANGYVSETKTELNGNIATAKTEVMTEVNKKPNILELSAFDRSLPLPLDATYYYGGLPTHSVTGTAYDSENKVYTDYIGICINHEDDSGYEPQHHDVMVFVKSSSNYIYSETFNTSEASGYLEEHVARALGSVNATPSYSGLMSAEDKRMFDDVVAQVVINEANIEGLKSKTDSISKQSTQSEEQAIIYETDEGVQVGKIDANGADFANLNRGGQQVARMSDLPTVPTLDTSIGSSPSNSHTPSSKAVKDYVDANIPEVPEYPIETESTSSDTEEVIFGNDAGTQQYAKVSSEGVRAVAYKDMQGNNVIPVKDTSIGNNPSNTNVPTTKAVKDYVDAHSGDYPIEKETTQSDDEEQVWENDAETQEYAKIGSYGIKSKAYLDMQGNPIIDGEIGDTPSTTHAPSAKAVADYVDEHGGGAGGLPISKEDTQDESAEVIWGNDAGTQEYMKVGSYGIMSKAYLDMNGNPIGGRSVSVQTISGKNYLVFS